MLEDLRDIHNPHHAGLTLLMLSHSPQLSAQPLMPGLAATQGKGLAYAILMTKSGLASRIPPEYSEASFVAVPRFTHPHSCVFQSRAHAELKGWVTKGFWDLFPPEGYSVGSYMKAVDHHGVWGMGYLVYPEPPSAWCRPNPNTKAH